MLVATPQGRHRYFRLASSDAAEMLERMLHLADQQRPKPVRTGPQDAALRQLRTCYDHMAGTLAVQLFEGLVARGHLRCSVGAGELTTTGISLFSDLGIDLPTRKATAAAPLCRPCMDWSERRFHLGGAAGRALHRAFVERDWVRSQAGARVLTPTAYGLGVLEREFGLTCIPALTRRTPLDRPNLGFETGNLSSR